MSQDPRGRTASGPGDTGLIERAEALLDEAVGQAAKGSYGEAADKVQQALAIDPDNAVAHDLLESYRRQVADDDERRRRRRSIAAAAAAIEEMVESERIEEASAATEALAMQFGLDAPVEELRRTIGAARAVQLDFHDLDAAMDAIRLPNEGGPQRTARTDAGSSVVAQIEEHLRSGRLDEASRELDRLESEPGSEERARKLRARIEEALHVAAEHRREEEILIATAAIEERLRRGSIDDAAQRLNDLAERHGSSAPVAELRERLAEARALAHQAGAYADATGETAGVPTGDRVEPANPIWQSMIEEESVGGGSRWVAIAVVVAIVLAGLWWWSTRSPAPTAESTTGDSPAAVEGAAASGQSDSPATSDRAAGRPEDAAQQSAGSVDPPRAQTSAPAVAESDAGAPQSPPEPAAGARSSAPPPAVQEEAAAAPNSAAVADTAADRASPAAPPESPASATDENAGAANALDNATQVVVEAVSVAEAPPPEPAPPPVETSVESSSVSDSPEATADSAAPPPADSPPARAVEPEPVAAPVESQQAAAAPAREAPPPAAAPASTAPRVLGCGEAGVVCLKAIQVPTPKYPPAARARRLNADVVVMALVDERGRVIETRVDSGSFHFFNEAATDAAERATFQPATRQGVPGRSWARLTFKFD